MEPFIHLDNIPHHLLLQFEKGVMFAAGWEDLISEAVLYDTMDNHANRKKEDQAPGNDSLDDGEFKDNSTIMSGMDECYYDDVMLRLASDEIVPLRSMVVTLNWRPLPALIMWPWIY